MVAFIPMAKPTGRCFESKSKRGAHRVTHLFDPLAIRDITFANRRKPTNSSEVESKEFYLVCGDAENEGCYRWRHRFKTS
jgi:hypothetical protein